MNAEEVAKVLAKIRLGDNRETSRETLLEWIDNIGDLDFADAIEAVRLHRKESLEYLMPAHIRAGVKRIKAERNPSSDTSPERFKQLERGEIRSAPKPDNFDALRASWNDPVRFAAECARYDEQLVAAGFPPVERGRWAA